MKYFVCKAWCAIVVVVGSCVVVLAGNFCDSPVIRSGGLSNGACLAMSAASVTTRFAVVRIQTNGTLLQITARDVCGVGTNAEFAYSLRDMSNVLSVACRDASSNGFDCAYFPGGGLRKYVEYARGTLDGVYVEFFTNKQISLYMNTSNNWAVGTVYEFNQSGAVINAMTSDVPVSLHYRHPGASDNLKRASKERKRRAETKSCLKAQEGKP